MKAIKLTAEQAFAIQGKNFSRFQVFNVITVGNENYLYLSDKDMLSLEGTEYSYLTKLEKVDVAENNDKPSYEN